MVELSRFNFERSMTRVPPPARENLLVQRDDLA
jgi:hypothetical protein